MWVRRGAAPSGGAQLDVTRILRRAPFPRSHGTTETRPVLLNQANQRIAIDPRTAEIRIEGEPLPLLPDDHLPLNRRYVLF